MPHGQELPIERLRESLAQTLHDRSRARPRRHGDGVPRPGLQARPARSRSRFCIPISRPALGPDRFLREIKLAARLNHPHILPLHDSGEADGFLYYVMPYVEGESLRERLDRDQQLSDR